METTKNASVLEAENINNDSNIITDKELKIKRYKALLSSLCISDTKSFCGWKKRPEKNPDGTIKRISKPPLNIVNLSEDNDVTLSKTTVDLKTAIEHFEEKYTGREEGKNALAGIGLQINYKINGTCFIDLDHCIKNGIPQTELSKLALKIFANTYIEYSQSREGLHILCKIKEDIKLNTKKFEGIEADSDVEIYKEGRYCALTGDRYNQNDITEQTDNVKIFIQLCLGLSKKDEKLKKLLFDTSHVGDESAQDESLFSKLKYWLKDDKNLVYKCYKLSPYYESKAEEDKKKTDTVHYSNGDTYFEGSYKRAIADNSTNTQGGEREPEKVAKNKEVTIEGYTIKYVEGITGEPIFLNDTSLTNLLWHIEDKKEPFYFTNEQAQNEVIKKFINLLLKKYNKVVYIDNKQVKKPEEAQNKNVYPINIFPESIKNELEKNAENMGTSVSVFCTALLQSICTVTLNKIKLIANPNSDYIINPSMYSIIVGQPSVLKTPIIDKFKKIIASIEIAINSNLDEEFEEFEELEASYKAELEKWIRDKNKKGEKPEKPTPPKPFKILIDSPTVEGIISYLQQIQVWRKKTEFKPEWLGESKKTITDERINPSIWNDEIDGFFQDFNKYTGGKGGDKTFYMTARNGSFYSIERKGLPTESARIRREKNKTVFILLSIIGTTQPDKLSKIIKKGKEINDGFIQRFFIVKAEGEEPKPDIIAKLEKSEEIIKSLFKWILKNKGEIIFRFSKEAQTYFNNKMIEYRKESGNTDLTEFEQGYIGKMIGYLGESSLYLHLVKLFQNGQPEFNNTTMFEIPLETVEEAEALCKYYKNSFFEFCEENTQEKREERHLLKIVRKTKDHTITVAQLKKNHQSIYKKQRPEQAQTDLEYLSLDDYGYMIQNGKTIKFILY